MLRGAGPYQDRRDEEKDNGSHGSLSTKGTVAWSPSARVWYDMLNPPARTVRRPVPTMLSTLLVLAISLTGGPADKVGKFDHRKIAEPSGIVASRKHPGIFWVHNDSGNAPLLFAVKQDGSLLREYSVEATNLDWEDLAIDNSGHLYIGDIGNNLRALPIRVIYRVDEPDPTEMKKDKGVHKLKVSAAIYFAYPSTGAFDAEGLFIDGDRAIVVAKSQNGSEAELFAIPLRATSLLKPARAERVGSLKGFKKPATGADLSADGRMLSVCALGEVRIYRRDADGRWLPFAKMKGPDGQVEAIGWDGSDLVLANEDREIFRITEKTWRGEARKKGEKP